MPAATLDRTRAEGNVVVGGRPLLTEGKNMEIVYHTSQIIVNDKLEIKECSTKLKNRNVIPKIVMCALISLHLKFISMNYNRKAVEGFLW